MPFSQDVDAFFAKYVDTNTASGSPPFDRKFLFDDVLARLQNVGTETFNKLALPVVAAQCCAINRADLIPAMFLSIHDNQKDAESIVLQDFICLRETITIIWPFVGIPKVIPACLGLSKCLEAHGLNAPKPYRLENGFEVNDGLLGTETRREIYKASANSEIFDMLDKNFGDLARPLNGVAFGYNIGHADPSIFSLAEAELLLTAALIGLGATRQAGSHIKACIGFGYTESDIKAIVETARKLAQWQSGDVEHSGLSLVVNELARQARSNLGNESS